jgi:hypothetical protein
MPPLLSGRLVLPPLCVRVPAAFGEQPVDVRKVTVAADKEAQPCAVGLSRPLAIPRLAACVIRIEPDAPQSLPAAMRTALDVAAVLVLLTDARPAIDSRRIYSPSASYTPYGVLHHDPGNQQSQLVEGHKIFSCRGHSSNTRMRWRIVSRMLGGPLAIELVRGGWGAARKFLNLYLRRITYNFSRKRRWVPKAVPTPGGKSGPRRPSLCCARSYPRPAPRQLKARKTCWK